MILLFSFKQKGLVFAHYSDPENAENQEDEDQQDQQKIAERDNRRNCQQVYTSSPVKSGDKIPDDVSGKYIS